MMSSTETLSLYTLLATCASAIATIIYVIYTARYVRLTHEILKVNKEAIFEQSRPYLVVHIESENHWTDLIIQNIGNRPAKDVQITFNPPLSSLSEKVTEAMKMHYEPLLLQKFIPPNYHIRTAMFPTSVIVDNPECQTKYEVSIKYYDLYGHFFEEGYAVDLATYIYARKEAKLTPLHYYREFFENILKKMEAIEAAIIKNKE